MMVHYNLGTVPEWQWNINKEKETGMRQVILERYMFEKSMGISFEWEGLLDKLGVDQVSINPDDPEDMEYPDRVQLTVTKVRVVE